MSRVLFQRKPAIHQRQIETRRSGANRCTGRTRLSIKMIKGRPRSPLTPHLSCLHSAPSFSQSAQQAFLSWAGLACLACSRQSKNGAAGLKNSRNKACFSCLFRSKGQIICAVIPTTHEREGGKGRCVWPCTDTTCFFSIEHFSKTQPVKRHAF